MNCYKHNDNSAIGICKYCMKGLCTECAVEIGNTLSCKNSCENQVEKINTSQKNQSIIQPYAKAAQKIGPLGLLIYGIYLSVYWSGIAGKYVDFGLVGLGAICIIAGGLLTYKGFKQDG